MPSEVTSLPGCQQQTLSPFGLLVESSKQTPLNDLPLDLMKQLVLHHRLLVLRGLTPFLTKENLAAYCSQWGELLAWDFGYVFEVVEHDDPRNYLFTSGSVPYHWDGAFADRVPWLQVFQCCESPGTAQGGATLFCDTARVWKNTSPEEQQVWKRVEIEYFTQKVAHYGGAIRAALVDRHPMTGETTLRFAEPANADTVQLNTPELKVHGLPEEESARFLKEFTQRLYHPEHVHAHAWVQGDLVIADNHVLLHGRSAYLKQTPRRLWRVHVLESQ